MLLSPIIFNTRYKVPLMRERDKPIMNVFRESRIWQMEQLLVLQCVRRHKNVYVFSYALECDNRTVMSSIMDDSEGTSEWTFPKEKPWKKVFELWRTALQNATSNSLTIQSTLGPYIRQPCNNVGWYISSDNLCLYKKNCNGTFDSFRKSPNAQQTKRIEYIMCAISYSPPLDIKISKYASVTIQKWMINITITLTAWCLDNLCLTYSDLGWTLTYEKN